MASLRIGYNVFSGSSQAGTDAGIPGTVQAETSQKGKHAIGVQRLSDNRYYNATTKVFDVARPAEADEIEFRGSDSDRGIQPAIRRLEGRLPFECNDGITAAGFTVFVYPTGGQAGGNERTMTLVFKPTTNQ